jgi:hypothetical protein
MMKAVSLGAVVFCLAAGATYADWLADVEAGAVFSGYNDVRVPNEGGTEISLSRDLETDPGFFYRLRVWYRFNDRHAVSVFAAPLRLEASGAVGKAVLFENVEFPANAPLDATYRFDSYRATYRYNLVRRERLIFGIGFTAKVRDAAISIRGDGVEAETTNTGFVPLFNFGLRWRAGGPWTFVLDGDALGASQGRAEDVFVGTEYRLHKNASLKAGYRMIEGGADVPQVYNFTMLHFLALGPVFEF